MKIFYLSKEKIKMVFQAFESLKCPIGFPLIIEGNLYLIIVKKLSLLNLLINIKIIINNITIKELINTIIKIIKNV